MPKGGFEPPSVCQHPQHQHNADPASSIHFNALPLQPQHGLTPGTHQIHTSVRESCAPSVPENSASLIAIIEACDWLSHEVRNQLVVVLRQSREWALITAIASRKGGVSKTTTAVSLSAALAGIGKRVLLVDLDSQASASLSLGVPRSTLFPETRTLRARLRR